MNLSYDPNNRYSIPYFFWNRRHLYDKEKYPNETFDSWGDLYHSQLKNDILLVDGAREIIGMGLNKLGYSLNDKNPTHIHQAEKDLHNLAPQVRDSRRRNYHDASTKRRTCCSSLEWRCCTTCTGKYSL